MNEAYLDIVQDFGRVFGLAFTLVASADADFVAIVALSLRVSLTAMVFSCTFRFPLGALPAIGHFPESRTFLERMVGPRPNHNDGASLEN